MTISLSKASLISLGPNTPLTNALPTVLHAMSVIIEYTRPHVVGPGPGTVSMESRGKLHYYYGAQDGNMMIRVHRAADSTRTLLEIGIYFGIPAKLFYFTSAVKTRTTLSMRVITRR